MKSRLKATVPETAENFILMLKRHANLIYALFTDNCSYFKSLVLVITALKALSRTARASMSSRTKASILWIILSQSRQFSNGEFNVLSSFSKMHDDLQAKSAVINHSETPQELYVSARPPTHSKAEVTPTWRQRDSETAEEPPTKKLKSNPNCWHPKLKEALIGPLHTAGDPTFTAILKYCGANFDSLYPQQSRVCGPNILLGRCWRGKACTKIHTTAKDNEVDKILQMVKKFVDEPTGIKQG